MAIDLVSLLTGPQLRRSGGRKRDDKLAMVTIGSQTPNTLAPGASVLGVVTISVEKDFLVIHSLILS